MSDGGIPSELRNLRVGAKQIHRLRKEVVGLSLAQRLTIPGLDPRRADLVVAGGVLLDTILRRLGAEDITLCDLALREGLVLDYSAATASTSRTSTASPTCDDALVELAERCNYYMSRAAGRAARARDLRSDADHAADRSRARWLEFAAPLDIGSLISYERLPAFVLSDSERRSARLRSDEIEVVALVARYHRRGTPKRSHEEYSKLPSPLRKTDRLLASILRVAESLDRSHTQTIASLDLRDRGVDALLQVHSTGDAELEVWATNRHLQPFERIWETDPPRKRRYHRAARPQCAKPRETQPSAPAALAQDAKRAARDCKAVTRI
jgi:exopolyphosphatase/guanosine-5'-triphosphate,3'-diphosphate pyrophosphatase